MNLKKKELTRIVGFITLFKLNIYNLKNILLLNLSFLKHVTKSQPKFIFRKTKKP